MGLFLGIILFIFLFGWIFAIIGILIVGSIGIKNMQKPVVQEAAYKDFYSAPYSRPFVFTRTHNNSNEYVVRDEGKNAVSGKKPSAAKEVLPPDYDGSTISELQEQLTDDESDVVSSQEYREELDRSEETIDYSDIPEELGEKID